MQKILAIFLMLFSCQLFAADEGDWWLQRQIQIGDGKNQYGKKVYGTAARSVIESVPIENSTREEVRQLIKRSIAVDMPTASKVGKPMLSRVQALVKSPGGAFIGALAVTQLLEAIGWVMEDGTYVKKIPEDDKDTTHPYLFYENRRPDKVYSDRSTGASSALAYYKTIRTDIDFTGVKTTTDTSIGGVAAYACYNYQGKNYCDDTILMIKKNDNYDPNAQPKEKTVPLTAPVLGAIMMGQGYSDPAGDTNAENIVNDGDYTGVKEIYEHDPSGTGDDLANDMDDKLRNAPDTTDGKPSYIGDPKYDDKQLIEDDDSADRSWNEDGDTATGGTEQEVDSDGNPTGNTSISLQFPLFCSWASKMCQWYDDWKASDKVYKDHMIKTEEHQTEEKTFWQDVKDWFDWSKEEPTLENEELEIDDQEVIPYVEENHVVFGKTCPFTPQAVSMPLGTIGSMDFETDLSFICDFGYMANPYVLGIGHLGALIFLLIGIRNGNA